MFLKGVSLRSEDAELVNYTGWLEQKLIKTQTSP